MGFVSFMILVWEHMITFSDEVREADFELHDEQNSRIYNRWNTYGKATRGCVSIVPQL